MARAIQPFSMSDDGDTLFAVSTAEGKAPEISDEDLSNLSSLASETAWDAIASLPVLPVATPRTNVTLSSAALASIAGHYTIAPDVIAELRHKGDTLEIELTGRTTDYLSAGHPLTLSPVAADEFEVVGPAGTWCKDCPSHLTSRLNIDRDERGAVVGITINPGPRPVHAVRKQIPEPQRAVSEF